MSVLLFFPMITFKGSLNIKPKAFLSPLAPSG